MTDDPRPPHGERPPDGSEEPDGDERRGREFEKWALLGVAAVLVLCLIALERRRLGAGTATGPPGDDEQNVVRVQIGGPVADRPVAEGSREGRAGDPPSPPPAPGPSAPAPSAPGATPAPGAGGVPLPVPHGGGDEREGGPGRTYVVRENETLSEIALRELGSVDRVDEIVRLNEIRDANLVRAGDELRLPAR